MLCSGTTLGTRDAVMKYLHRMAREFDNWVQDPKCRFATIGDDQSIHNYLFYTGQLPYATAIPHRSGIVHTVGIEGSNLYQDHVAYWKTKGKDQGYANSQPYQTATDKTWIQSELVDDYGFFTNMDGTRSRVVHQYDRFRPPLERWLSQSPVRSTPPHVALYDSKRNMYNTPLLPSEYKSRTTPQLRVHIWDDGNPYKKRERLLNIEGVSSHPNTSLVETPNEADIILWISTRSADETPPTNFSNVVVLDYSDGWDLHQKRSLLKGEKAYLKRSWVERDDGQFQRVGPGATQGAMPLFYGAASANVRPFTPHASKKHSIVNVLRDEGADHNRNRKRVTQWTQFFVTKHNVTDAAIGPMSTGWAGSDWDSTYMNHLASARIIVTCNPNNWVGDFRLWESMVSGAMVMVDRMYVMELLPHPLINKLHYVVYDSSNRTEFIELLEYYISRPDVTERIARAGYEWTLAHHMPRHRVDYILNNINLSSGSSSGTLAPTLL